MAHVVHMFWSWLPCHLHLVPNAYSPSWHLLQPPCLIFLSCPALSCLQAFACAVPSAGGILFPASLAGSTSFRSFLKPLWRGIFWPLSQGQPHFHQLISSLPSFLRWQHFIMTTYTCLFADWVLISLPHYPVPSTTRIRMFFLSIIHHCVPCALPCVWHTVGAPQSLLGAECILNRYWVLSAGHRAAEHQSCCLGVDRVSP